MSFPPPPPPPPPPATTLEGVEQELHELMVEHARLRDELEERFGRVRSIEDRFLALRPKADHATQRELRRRMILARPWREELDGAYQALLATAHRLGAVARQIHEAQLRAAQMAAMPGGPQPSSPPPPPPDPSNP